MKGQLSIPAPECSCDPKYRTYWRKGAARHTGQGETEFMCFSPACKEARAAAHDLSGIHEEQARLRAYFKALAVRQERTVS